MMAEFFGIFTMILAIAGVLLNNRKMSVCFYFWLCSNALSAAIHLQAGIWSLACRDIIFFVLAIEGIAKWRKTRNKKGKEYQDGE
jgi:nicotinamide riboside transporter PnuC